MEAFINMGMDKKTFKQYRDELNDELALKDLKALKLRKLKTQKDNFYLDKAIEKAKDEMTVCK